MNDVILGHLQFLYGAAVARETGPRFEEIIARYQAALNRNPDLPGGYFNEKDVVLIAYGDMVRTAGERPLQTLESFLSTHVAGTINTVHLLPFFPYSSDDGFSVIDYRQVDPALGEWSDIAALGGPFRLMFDAVVNHVSAQSFWFQRFLQDESPYRDYFIVVSPNADLAQVFRPRSLPLLSQVTTASGQKHVWTTFSADQVDLNFANPDVLLEVLDTLLFYVEQGAELIRLDAIAFIWKEQETACIHLPQTHHIIQLMRSVLDIVAPNVLLITETNVPHRDNVSYFGDGYDEAQMVYNFSLPPLTLHAFHEENAEVLSGWAERLELPSKQVSFFNFLASHDGIGLTPARDLLSDQEIAAMADRIEKLGGYVSYRSSPDGSESPYELNISYIDALGKPDVVEEEALVARRFLAAQAIMLALRGVPGIYFHSLFGSRSWPEGVEQTGHKRTINRQKLQRAELEHELDAPRSLRAQVFSPYIEMLQRRTAEPALHPTADQQIVRVHPALFALWRHTAAGDQHVLCLHNVANRTVSARVELPALPGQPRVFRDLLSGKQLFASDNSLFLEIPPYGVYWLKAEES